MSITRLKRFGAAAVVGLVVFVGSSSPSLAQSFGDLSKLLGGDSGHSHNSNQSVASVTVQRGDAPYMGTFNGKQTTSSGSDDLSTRFACYPARAPAFSETKTFVCYAAQ
jgi:hypothetical protein